MKKIKFVLVSLFSLFPIVSSCKLLSTDNNTNPQVDNGGKENTNVDNTNNENQGKEEVKEDPKEEEPKQEDPKVDPKEEEPKQDDPKEDPKPADPSSDNPGQGGEVVEKYTVYWYNENTLLSKDVNVEKGSTPSYKGNTPTKSSTSEYNYVFLGWNTDSEATSPLSTLPKIYKDTTFYAIFEAKAIELSEKIAKLKNDKRYLTSQGEGYTYLDYDLNVKYKSWDKLVEDGNFSFSGSFFAGNNLDTLGKGVLQFPKETKRKYLAGSNNDDPAFSKNELLDGVIIPGDIDVDVLYPSLFNTNQSIRTLEFSAPTNSTNTVFKTISSNAFKECTALESIKLLNSNIKTISTSAFYGCTSLKAIDFSNLTNLESFGTNVFQNCTSLSSINFSNTISKVPISCFEGCTGLKELTFSSTKEIIIDSSSFGGCNLSKITINSPINCIGSYNFTGNPNLSTISFGTNGKIIFDDAYGSFSGCTGIKNLDFSKVEFKNKAATIFKNCGFVNLDLSNSTFTELPDSLFYECESLTTVTFSSKIKTIGRNAFFSCDSLTSINGLSTSGITLGDYCFQDCIKLDTMNSSKKLTFTDVSLGRSAFEKTAFSSISVANNITNNGLGFDASYNAFSKMSNLTTATIKLTNSYILSRYMFYNCKNLTTVDIEVPYDTSLVDKTNKTDNNKFEAASVDYSTFFGCDALTTINFSGTVDQLMYYYRIIKNYSDLDIPFKLKNL